MVWTCKERFRKQEGGAAPQECLLNGIGVIGVAGIDGLAA